MKFFLRIFFFVCIVGFFASFFYSPSIVFAGAEGAACCLESDCAPMDSCTVACINIPQNCNKAIPGQYGTCHNTCNSASGNCVIANPYPPPATIENWGPWGACVDNCQSRVCYNSPAMQIQSCGGGVCGQVSGSVDENFGNEAAFESAG